RRRRARRDGEGLMSDSPNSLPILGDDGKPQVGVYGAPRPAVPERVPLAPRFGGCASGAGVGLGADAASFRRLPEWLKVKLPGTGDYAETESLLRRHGLRTA